MTMSDRITPIGLDRFRAEVLALYGPPLRAKATHDKMRHVLDLVASMPGAETTADLTTATVARFLAARPPGEAPHTTYGLLSYLRAACNHAAAEGYVRVSPFTVRKHWLRVPPADPARRRHHSRAEIARVLALMEGIG